MKYPFVIFYRKNTYNYIDKFFIQNANMLECTIFLANSIEHVKNLYNSNFHLLVSYGETENENNNELLTVFSDKMLMVRHIKILPNTLNSPITPQFNPLSYFNKLVNSIYVSMCSFERSRLRPTFSLFTPSYNSYHKILRVYNSLLKQTLLDWEWIIMDDSPDDTHFKFLRDNFSNEPRIRFYRRSCNNGSIGNVKNETIGLCRGKYLLEMDHDDELMPYVLEESAQLFDSKPDIGFIYFDCASIYENGENQWYGDFICKGYGGYYSQKYDGKWLLIYITPNINNITMSHLVCCPNHPRIWRRDTLINMGSYSEYLPICDDYEILLRTSINTNIAKIHKLGYIQYMNNDNNNFSLIRNAEINRIGPNYISPIYYELFDINNKMKYKDAYEDETYINNHSRIWERDQNTYKHKFCNLIINNDYNKQFCIIGIDSFINNIDRIQELYNDHTNDFIILDNKRTVDYLQHYIDTINLPRIKCYTILNASVQQLINYFKLLYLCVGDYEIINSNIKKPKFNSNFTKRVQVINTLTKNTDKYLEIGVEYGECFNETHFTYKVGVDPDPKATPIIGTMFQLTSDNFFNHTNKTLYDAIFIDGMHQAEFVLRDINNSIMTLHTNGIIFIDDILPNDYNEQLKKPMKHYYENGILKYGETWTGDVWKVIYHLLVHYKNKIKNIQYFYSPYFRGILSLQVSDTFQINPDDIQIINNYEYFKDFNNYIDVLTN